MWSKLTSAIRRPNTPSLSPEDDEQQSVQPNVLGGVYEKHPNLSVFYQDAAEVPFPSPSPPPSPSKRKGLLKRISKNPFAEHELTSHSSPVRPNIGLPKKVKSSIHSIATGSDISLHRNLDTNSRPPEDTARPSNDSAIPPATPVTESKFGSIRSILRPGNTPGTGQSVRFFSRDAYKIITPEVSSASEMDDPCIEGRFNRRGPSSRVTAQELFSPLQDEVFPAPVSPIPPSGMDSLMLPLPSPEMGNLFDISSDRELPAIPAHSGPSLLDGAVEISEPEDGATELKPAADIADIPEPPQQSITPSGDSPQTSPNPNAGRSTPTHDRSHSFSFGQTVFHSLPSQAMSTPADESVKGQTKAKHSRNRAASDSVFQNMIHPPPNAAGGTKLPEAEINDTSTALVVMGSPEKEKDPFGAHATTYYTPGTMLPPSPPASTHTRKASREEDLIWSLRTQLALQSELCAQFELDLGARDELVQTLSSRLTETERECERRKNVIKNWRKRVAELEKCVRSLEDEVDRSREESVERSVMDEASGEALRMLHRQIGDLEREKKEKEKKEQEMMEELEAKSRELERMKEDLEKRDQSERELKAGIRAAREEMESMGKRQSQTQTEDQQGEFKLLLAKSEEQSAARAAWEEERTALLEEDATLRKEHVDLQSRLTDAREEIIQKEHDMTVLRAELEAQWRHTERASEDMEQFKREKDQLEKEREQLKSEVVALHENISNMEMEHNGDDNRAAELEKELDEAWREKEDLERQKEELEAHLRAEEAHADELTNALQEREDRVTELTQERQYTQESLSRLQENLRQRDAELASLTSRVHQRELQIEELESEISRLKREHSRTVDEQSRRISEVVAREVEARAAMEEMLRGKAETDVMQGTLKERVEQLRNEIERLRRQVHELQQESADKEVKLAQMAKQRAQDKEDLAGLNIALDSKQQELELLKRRVATAPARASAGSTPAATSKTPYRRESSIFGTPSVSSRPPSVASDTGSTMKERKANEPPSVARATLVRSVRHNASSSISGSTASKRVDGSMGPPPFKRSSLAQSTTATPTRVPSTGSTSSTSSTFSRSTSMTPTANTARRPSVSQATVSRLRPTVSSRESLKTQSVNSVSEEEKENVSATLPKPRRRLSAIPA